MRQRGILLGQTCRQALDQRMGLGEILRQRDIHGDSSESYSDRFVITDIACEHQAITTLPAAYAHAAHGRASNRDLRITWSIAPVTDASRPLQSEASGTCRPPDAWRSTQCLCHPRKSA